jgi:thiamine-phosphate pyrophosphorylase
MSDERIGDLIAAITRLPRRSGIIFRHYTLSYAARRALFKAVRRAARAGNHLLILADRPTVARQWGADGAHERSARVSFGLRTVAVHTVRERMIAKRVKAELVFVSPVRTSRSHPGASPLGRLGFARVAGNWRSRSIALGGMNQIEFQKMRALELHGWAAIDALSPSKA